MECVHEVKLMKIIKEIWMVIIREWGACGTSGSTRHHHYINHGLFALLRVVVLLLVLQRAIAFISVLVSTTCLFDYLPLYDVRT